MILGRVAPVGSQALPGGLWDGQHVVCCGQQGEGQKWQPPWKPQWLAGQEASPAAMWRRSRLAAESEWRSGMFIGDTRYRGPFRRTTFKKECINHEEAPPACRFHTEVSKSEFRRELGNLGQMISTSCVLASPNEADTRTPEGCE